MAWTDSNNATWYMLRYATDFTPRTPAPGDVAPPQIVPPEAPTLFYDSSRYVLELVPVMSVAELTPPPGLAVDLDGQIYLVDPSTGHLLVRRCDGSQHPLLCEPGIVRTPGGLALDRRGYLYIADPALARVIVLRPDDASSVAILHEELTEPVDVAVAPWDTIYVADRAAGRIVTFTAGFRRKGHFIPQDPAGLLTKPRPVAIMIDADGTVLVADASYPRLLRFSQDGAPVGDVVLSTLVAPLQAAGISLSTPLQLLAGPAARIVAGACRPPFPANDGGVLLAKIHRYLRLLALKLNHSFATSGALLTTVFDSRMPGTIWHKIVVGALLPAGTSITVETATAESPEALVSAITSGPTVGSDLPWASPQQLGVPISFTKQVPDQLVQSTPGRYLRMRITLASDGTATPSLQWLKVLFPRVSYLDYLPRIYQRDPDAQLFLQHFLALFESVFTRVEDRYEEFSRWLNPQAAPLEMINWLGLLLDLTFDPSWPLARRRALVAAAMGLYRRRGTVGGLQSYVEIYTGTTPVILEAFLSRPGQPAFLGVGSSIVGSGLSLSPSSPTQAPAAGLTDSYAHRFTVLVYPSDTCDAETLLPVVDRIITVNKPAHTIHTLQAVYPDARVGAQSTIGLDLVVGGGTPPHTQLGGAPQAGHPTTGAGVLGVNTVLGNTRPE
jgi:phage tail-like protein